MQSPTTPYLQRKLVPFNFALKFVFDFLRAICVRRQSFGFHFHIYTLGGVIRILVVVAEIFFINKTLF